MISAPNVKLILRGFEKCLKKVKWFFMVKTKCKFLPLVAVCKKIKHSFISFLFHVPATLKDHDGQTSLSSLVLFPMQEALAVKIYAAFWLKLSASTPSDLQIWQELGEGLYWGTFYR